MQRRECRVLSMALALCLLTPLSTLAQVIDDFEQGTFNLSGTSSASGVQSFLLPIHCISDERAVAMAINGNPSTADLNLGAVDDEVAMVWGNGGGRVEFDYVLAAAGVDLSFGGTKNALRVRLPVAVAAGQLGILLHDSAGAPGERLNRPIFGAGTYSIPLSDFTAVDVGDVRFIQLILDIPDFGDYHVSDFRAWEDPAVAAGLDVTAGTVVGPPYPTGALQVEVWGQDGDTGGTVQTEILSMSLRSYGNEGGSYESELVAMDSGGGAGMPGEQATIVLNDVVNPTKRVHFRGAVYSLQRPPTTTYTPMMAGLPLVHPPDPGMPTSFAVEWASYAMDRSGVTQFRTNYFLSFQIPDGGNLIFTKAGIDPTPFEPTAFDVFFEVDVMTDAVGGSQKAGTPLVESQLSASSYHFSSATPSPAWTGEPVVLWAQPNVMSGSTQLWMSRALEKATRLRLFDLAGRAVRTVTIPAGQEFTTWDGRDARGVPVASGMYMLRALDAPGSSAAKLVKLR